MPPPSLRKHRVSARARQDAPIIDQYELNHSNNGAFCGIATMVMMLHANNLSQGTSRADLNAMAARVYHPGKGTSGSAMAGVLRERGLKDSTCTTAGTQRALGACHPL